MKQIENAFIAGLPVSLIVGAYYHSWVVGLSLLGANFALYKVRSL